MTSFKQLGLSEEVLKAISELGFERPSEIQAQAIPHLIDGYTDFIGLAQTGTGKTAAFGLPLLERIDPYDPSTQALILAPTRELGQQIAEQLALFSKYLEHVNVLAVYGGASITTQLKALRRPQHVIIATPGRLIDLIQRKAVKLGQLQYLILDEADEMLNMGFKEDLDKILTYTPEEKLVWLFSATMSREISRIVKTYMDDPVEIRLNTKVEVNVNIEHQFTIVRQSDKSEALTRFLDINPGIRGVVFCRTRRDTQELADELLKKNYKAEALHGDLSQRQRDRVMRLFKTHELQVLIATDIAARGIDVNDLTHVFHYSLPDDLAYYTHRSGRTARAGKKGTSIAFVNGRERGKIERLGRSLDISFEKVRIPSTDDIYKVRIENYCRQILEQAPKGKVDPTLLDKAHTLFGNLSKEELTAKLLMFEIAKYSSDSSKDLNQQDAGRSGNRRTRSRDWDRGKERRKGGNSSRSSKGKSSRNGHEHFGGNSSNASKPSKSRRSKSRKRKRN